jgi:enoyl-CoA hydratase/carnithine racemase
MTSQSKRTLGPTQIESSLAAGVLHLVFVTETGLNTMVDAWSDALEAHLRNATDDKSVRIVLLSGRGRVFCAGANLQRIRAGALRQGFAASPLERLVQCLSRFSKPLLTAVHGMPIGGGATPSYENLCIVGETGPQVGTTASGFVRTGPAPCDLQGHQS